LNIKNKLWMILCIFLSNIAFADELPSVRYVISKDGLNKREAASASSRKTGILLYGSRVIIHEKSNNMETIDGITDYWYRCNSGGWFWVFGGYLSTIIPPDTEPVLGYWNTDKEERYYWDFRPDHTVSSGKKETDTGWQGIWTLSGNHLTIITTPKFDYDGTRVTQISESETLEITITVINHDRILLNFTDRKRELLDRNNNIY